MKTISLFVLAAALAASAGTSLAASTNPITDMQVVIRDDPQGPRTDDPSRPDEHRDDPQDKPADNTDPADEGGDQPQDDVDPPSQPESPLPGHRDESIKDGASCVVHNYTDWAPGDMPADQNFAVMTNTGTVNWPAGTIIRVQLPNGNFYDLEITVPVMPGGNWSIISDTPWPADWTCAPELILPDPNP